MQLKLIVLIYRKNELIDAAEKGKKPKMSEIEKAWYDVVTSQEMADAEGADRVPGSKWEMPSSKTAGPEVAKVIEAFENQKENR